MKNKVIIGITGGIGSGKSTVAGYIKENYSADVISADEVGRELMEPGKALYEVILNNYGSTVMSDNGTICKNRLSEIVFSSPEEQRKINSLEHPVIRNEILNRIEASKKNTVFLEAALLKEGELISDCDFIITVTASLKTRTNRLMSSRRYSCEKCESIIKKQLSEKEFREFSDFVIENDGDFDKTKTVTDVVLSKIGVKKREI